MISILGPLTYSSYKSVIVALLMWNLRCSLQDQFTQRLASMHPLQTCVDYAHQQLKQALDAFDENLDSLNIKKLESIARVRFAFTQAAKWMYQLEIEKNPNVTSIAIALKRFLSEVKLVCENMSFDWPL